MTRSTAALHQTVTIQHRMNGAFGRYRGYRRTCGSGALGSYEHPRWCARASRSGYSSPPETEAGWHTDRDACFCRSALERHIPYSDRRSYNPSCGRSRTLCRVPPSARRRATNCSLSSITEHSFQGITPSLKKKRESVTYVFGTICHLCLESLTEKFQFFRRTIEAG